MIAYYFPPGGGVGVQRSVKFVKYLPEMNWQPIVLTANIPLGIPIDSMLLKGIAPLTTVMRVDPLFTTKNCFSSSRGFISRLLCACLIPDAILPWVYPAVKMGMKIIREKKVQVIYSTSPPHSSHFVGYYLNKKTGIPWVADFRDAWLADPDRNKSFHNRLRSKTIEHWQEKLVTEKANKIISVSEGINEDFLLRYPRIENDKLIIIPNGFDPDDFKDIEKKNYSKFTFVLTSSMSKPNRSPKPLLEGLKVLLSQYPEIRNNFQVYLVGAYTEEQKIFLTQQNLDGVVRMFGEVSHIEALEFQVNADVNLFIYNGPGDGRSSQMLSGKIFEYIGAGHPIMAISSPDSAACKLVRELKLGQVASPDSPEDIAMALKQMMSSSKTKVSIDMNGVEQFHRRVLTEKLANVFELIKGMV